MQVQLRATVGRPVQKTRWYAGSDTLPAPVMGLWGWGLGLGLA